MELYIFSVAMYRLWKEEQNYDDHDSFKENTGAYSEEQGQRLHKNLQHFERLYRVTGNENMMGDYS